MHDSYQNPLCTRYAGKDMQRIFSDAPDPVWPRPAFRVLGGRSFPRPASACFHAASWIR